MPVFQLMFSGCPAEVQLQLITVSIQQITIPVKQITSPVKRIASPALSLYDL
jgi:hypothetical protein